MKKKSMNHQKKSGKYKKKDEIKSTLSLNKLSILVQSCCKSSTPETEENVQWTTGYPELYNKTMLTFFLKKESRKEKQTLKMNSDKIWDRGVNETKK